MYLFLSILEQAWRYSNDFYLKKKKLNYVCSNPASAVCNTTRLQVNAGFNDLPIVLHYPLRPFSCSPTGRERVEHIPLLFRRWRSIL